MDKEGGLMNRPPLLDGSNYDYWKSRMSAFLKSIDSKTWKVVLKAWEHPVVVNAEGVRTTVLKPEEEWSKEDDSDNEMENAAANHVSALTGRCLSDAESRYYELTHEELFLSYK